MQILNKGRISKNFGKIRKIIKTTICAIYDEDAENNTRRKRFKKCRNNRKKSHTKEIFQKRLRHYRYTEYKIDLTIISKKYVVLKKNMK